MTTILTHTFRINATSKNDTKAKQSKTKQREDKKKYKKNIKKINKQTYQANLKNKLFHTYGSNVLGMELYIFFSCHIICTFVV